MRYIAVAIVMFAIILVVANEYVIDRNDKSTPGFQDSDIITSPLDPEFLTLSDAQTTRLTDQMDRIAAQISVNRSVATELINHSIRTCIAPNSPTILVDFLASFVQILSETTMLPESRRQENIAEKMISLGTNFDRWLAKQPPDDRDRIYNQMIANMNNPVKLFDCNDEWLNHAR